MHLSQTSKLFFFNLFGDNPEFLNALSMPAVWVPTVTLSPTQIGPTLRLPNFYGRLARRHQSLFVSRRCSDLEVLLTLFEMCAALLPDSIRRKVYLTSVRSIAIRRDCACHCILLNFIFFLIVGNAIAPFFVHGKNPQ